MSHRKYFGPNDSDALLELWLVPTSLRGGFNSRTYRRPDLPGRQSPYGGDRPCGRSADRQPATLLDQAALDSGLFEAEWAAARQL